MSKVLQRLKGPSGSEYTVTDDGSGGITQSSAAQTFTSLTGPAPTVVTADTTLTAADSGKTIVVNAADKTITLPSTAAGLSYTIVSINTGSATGTSISPAAADKLIGNGFTAADNKDAINTTGTAAVGDTMSVVGDGSLGWYITNVIGTWAREG